MRVLAPTFTNAPTATDAEKAALEAHRVAARKAARTRRMNAEKLRRMKLSPAKLVKLHVEQLLMARDIFRAKKNWPAVEMIAAELRSRGVRR